MIKDLSMHAVTVKAMMILETEEESKVGGREVRCIQIYFAVAVAKVLAKIEAAVPLKLNLQRKF